MTARISLALTLFTLLITLACAGIKMNANAEFSPEFLYKIVSPLDWELSQPLQRVKLGDIDSDFIHLALRDQLPRILEKFWPNSPDALILELRPNALKGRLVKERNPGGETEYYHLYDGSIPLGAVVRVLRRQDLH